MLLRKLSLKTLNLHSRPSTHSELTGSPVNKKEKTVMVLVRINYAQNTVIQKKERRTNKNRIKFSNIYKQ